MGIDHRQKFITFSDSLDVDKALELQKAATDAGFACESAVTFRIDMTEQSQARSVLARILPTTSRKRRRLVRRARP